MIFLIVKVVYGEPLEDGIIEVVKPEHLVVIINDEVLILEEKVRRKNKEKIKEEKMNGTLCEEKISKSDSIIL